jgi:hypothetical protein
MRGKHSLKPDDLGAHVARSMRLARGNEDDVTGHDVIRLSADANLGVSRLIEDHFVDPVNVERDRVTDADLFDDHCHLGALVRGESPDGVWSPVVGIARIGERLEVEVAVETHAGRSMSSTR